nr:BspA family leucine-rich repeat surface protein [Campylobacter sp. P155]
MSNVTITENMFSYCSAFDEPIGCWDVSKVTDMGGMFESCSRFNQPLND